MDSNPRPLANLFAAAPSSNPAPPTAAAAPAAEDILSELDNVAFSLNQSPPSTTTNPSIAPPQPVQAPVFPALQHHTMAHPHNQPQQQHQHQQRQQPQDFAALQQQILMMRTLNSKNPQLQQQQQQQQQQHANHINMNNINNVNNVNNQLVQQQQSPMNRAHPQVNAAAHARPLNHPANRMSPVQKRARAPIASQQQQKSHHAQMFLAQQQHLARAGGLHHGSQQQQQQARLQQQQQQQQQMALRWSQHQQRMHAMNNPTNIAQLQAQQQVQHHRQLQQQQHAYEYGQRTQQHNQSQARMNGALSRLPAISSRTPMNNPLNAINNNNINIQRPAAKHIPPVHIPRPPVEKYGSELARKVCELEIEAARKRQRLEGAASKHHLHALAPDTNAQFADCFDAWQRLLPFHTMLPPDTPDKADNTGKALEKEKRRMEVGKLYRTWSEKLAAKIMDATAPCGNGKNGNSNNENNGNNGNNNMNNMNNMQDTELLAVAAMGFHDEKAEHDKIQAELKEQQRKEAERRHEEMLMRAAEAVKTQQQAQMQQQMGQQQHGFLQQQQQQVQIAVPHFAKIEANNMNCMNMNSMNNEVQQQSVQHQPLGMAEINAMPLPGIHDQQSLPQTEWPFEGGGRTTR